MREIGKILIYLCATILLGALLAPPLFWLGHWAGERFAIRVFVESDFPRYFNRAVLIAALALLWPAAKWLSLKSFAELELERDHFAVSNFLFGFLAALIVMIGLSFYMCTAGFAYVRSPIPWAKLLPVIASAIGASLIEEFFFRGVLLGVLIRSVPRAIALFCVSFVYSAVHFIHLPEKFVAPQLITFSSGLMLLPRLFDSVLDSAVWLEGFIALFILGWIFGFARLKTRALWLPIGLHSACILGKFGFGKLTKRTGEAMPWFGKDLQTGLGPVIVLLFLGLLVWLWLHYVRPHQNRAVS